ncbi:MAG TPA: hypothetical protein VI757_08380 [Bacteroidia bacterium]|nr:hypothetical protein [Bacteroidia bacterium]
MKSCCAIALIISSLLIYSCREDEMVYLPPVYFNYVPTNTGNIVIYDVDSTYYLEFDSTVHVFHFQVMERIDSTYLDNQNRPTQRIERFKRDSVGGTWYFLSVWNSTLTTSRFERVEENIRYVKLGFPISETQTWNGNAYNTLGTEEYYYLTFHEPLTIATFTFDSTLTVQQADDDNFIHKKYGLEKYANHIGRVYKEFIDVDKYPTGVYREGVVYKETINSYVP